LIRNARFDKQTLQTEYKCVALFSNSSRKCEDVLRDPDGRPALSLGNSFEARFE
jgi:hypothetical protein